jgi:hypothetical protein
VSTNEPTTMAKRFLSFCVSVLTGIAMLYLAVQLLAQFWGWLALIAGLIAAAWIVVRVVRWRRDRW